MLIRLFTLSLFLLFFIFIPNYVLAIEPEIISETEDTTTVRFYAEGGDGYIRSITVKDWDLIRRSISGDLIDMNNVRCESGVNSMNEYEIRRGFMPFNTSIIPDGSEILEASLNLFIQDSRSTQDDGYDWVTVVQTFQENPAGDLVNNDYSRCGDSIDSPTEGIDISERKDLSLIEGGKYLKFILNETGINWIDKINPLVANDSSKGTRYGIREGHDILDILIIGTYNIKNWLIAHDSSYGRATAPYLDVTFTGHLDDDDEFDPVILIPGIMGSWESNGTWQLDPILHTYDNLWQALLNAGYERNKNLFALPYEWRNSNIDNAILFKQKVEEVKDTSQSDKVDIVAHSMGGLLSRWYVQGGDFQDDIDQLIFLATPHMGATKSYLTWEGGETGTTLKDITLKTLMQHEAEKSGYTGLYSYVRTRPVISISELLPVYNYLYDVQTKSLRAYPDNYPVNHLIDYLSDPGHQGPLSDINITNIVAQAGAESTVNIIRVVPPKKKWNKWEHGYPYGYALPFGEHGLGYSQGDNTVPEQSNAGFLGGHDIVMQSTHTDVVTDAQKLVIQELTGTAPVDEVRETLIEKLLLIQVYSPIDILVTAPNGDRVGKDFESGLVVNKVAGAFYSGFNTEAEFVSIPNPSEGKYIVESQAVATGEYKISASLIGDNKLIEKDFTGFVDKNDKDLIDIVYLDNEDMDESLNFEISGFDKVLMDLEELYLAEEIKKDIIYKVLKNSFLRQQKVLNKNLNQENWWGKQLYKKGLTVELHLTLRFLDFYEGKDWLSSEANALLTSDIQFIIDGLP